jgi:hypothetical protein
MMSIVEVGLEAQGMERWVARVWMVVVVVCSRRAIWVAVGVPRVAASGRWDGVRLGRFVIGVFRGLVDGGGVKGFVGFGVVI